MGSRSAQIARRYQPQVPLTVDQVLLLALEAIKNKTKFVRLASRVPHEQRDALSRYAMTLSRARPNDRATFWHLLRVLGKVPQFEKDEMEMSSRRRMSLELSIQDRQALALLVKSHSLGRLIGATQTINFKSPGNKPHWGTKRKRRG